MNRKFNFEDINLIPKYSVVNSRSECDTSIQLGQHRFKNPVIPANMESVVNEEIVEKLANNGYFYVMHRFGTDNREFVENMNEKGLISSISIGVNKDSYDDIDFFFESDVIPNYITIDIAHGHCKKMKKMLKYVKQKLPNTFVIAGNVSSIEATVDLDKWGADAIKVGIGPGCFVGDTKIITSNGYKNISDIEINDLILTHKNKYEKVLATTSYLEEDDLIEINGNISTKKHKYYVVDKKYKNIINDDNYTNYTEWIEAEKLDKDKYLLKFMGKLKLTPINSKNIIENENEIMYDITVDNDKSYTANDIIVHNSACTTYPTTGFGSRNIQASVINDCSIVTKKHIIADGGIKYPSDITKSFVLGASMIMAGGMLASFTDSPGRTVELDGVKYKEFYGSASANQSNKSSRIEGTVKLNKMKDTGMIVYLEYLTECLQSSISYGGGKSLEDLYSVKWI